MNLTLNDPLALQLRNHATKILACGADKHG